MGGLKAALRDLQPDGLQPHVLAHRAGLAALGDDLPGHRDAPRDLLHARRGDPPCTGPADIAQMDPLSLIKFPTRKAT